MVIGVDSGSGDACDVALFDAASGTLLLYERVALLDQGHSRVRTPAVLSYVMFLAPDHADHLGQPTDQ